MNKRAQTLGAPKMSRLMTEPKYFRGSNFCLLATATLLAWAPTLPLLNHGFTQSAIAQNDPIEPPPSETPRNPNAPPAKDEPEVPSPKQKPVPGSEPTTTPDDLLDTSVSQPVTPPSLADGSNPEQALIKARAAMADSQWRLAIDQWTIVLNANPSNLEAKKGLEESESKLSQGSGSLLDNVSDDITVRRQKLRVEFENNMFSAGEKLNRGDYVGAQTDANMAKQSLNVDSTILASAELQAMNQRASTLIDQINESRLIGQQLDQAKQRADAQKSITDTQRMAQQKRLATISEMLMRVRQLQMELKYDEALQVIDQILFIDPSNPAALALRDVLESTKMYRQWADAQRQRNAGYGQIMLQDMQAAIPPKINLAGDGPRSTNSLMTYPSKEDWETLSFSNTNPEFAPVGTQRSQADLDIAKRMKKVVAYGSTADTTDVGTPIQSVLNTCFEAAGSIPFHVNWKALSEYEVTKETPVLFEGGNISPNVMLERILEQIGESEHPVFEIMDGQVVVTTIKALQNLPESKRPRVYDLTDLVFKYPDTVVVPPLQVNGGGGGGGGGGGAGGEGFPLQPFITEDGKSGRVSILKTLIQNTVDPEAWNSGATMEPFDTKLVITARLDTHRNIADLLKQLRDDLALQINVEVRVLKIDTDWFEQIGLDFDIYFNANNAQYENALQADPNFNLRDFFFQQGGTGTVGALKNPVVFTGIGNPTAGNAVATGQAIGLPNPGSPGQIQYQTGPVGVPVGVVKNGNTYANGSVSNGLSAINVQQEGLPLVNTLGAAGIKGVFGAAALANPAMTVGMTFLDDVQVDLLVRATQADQRNVLVTSPRLTMQNGQISFISVTDNQSYVSGFDNASGGATSTPIVSQISSGFALGLQGVISADRRYVSLNVSFQLQGPVTFSQVDFQQAITTASGSFTGQGSVAKNTFQTPNFQNTSIGTTITVPDKGTAVLGGQRVTTDFEVEVGVPVMSKIPVVNRFFTNRINNKTEQTLLLMIRPEILIQQETEDVLFPGLRNQLNGTSSDAGM